MKNEKNRLKKLAGIKENVVFDKIPMGLVRTVGELKKEIANLPDEMKLTSPDGPEINLNVYQGELTISTR